MSIPFELKEVANILLQNGFQVFLVGGAVRDFCLHKKPIDFDIATNALPSKVIKLFKRVIPTGIEHGTVTILYKGLSVECTTFRSDGKYTDSRHPDAVNFNVTIEEDLSRRDFTINAFAISFEDGKLIDLFNGYDDLKNKLVRAVGNPIERFTEDPLRMLRAIRFAAKLHFTIEKNTLNAIKELAPSITVVSKERIREEFSKMLLSSKPLLGLNLLHETNILQYIIPELSNCAGVTQGEFHYLDVLQHSFLVCQNTPCNLELRLAGLFHDVAKPLTRTIEHETGSIHFYKHEIEGEKLAKTILKQLTFPNVVVDNVCLLIRNHMFNYTSDWKDKTIRNFIARVGIENLDALIQLRLADIKALKPEKQDISRILEFKTRLDRILQETNCFTLKELLINGNDLINLGFPSGKTIGLVLQELLQTVLDDPSQNKRETLLRIAENLKQKYVYS